MGVEQLIKMLDSKRVVVIAEALDENIAGENVVAIKGNPLDQLLVRTAWRMRPDYILLANNKTE